MSEKEREMDFQIGRKRDNVVKGREKKARDRDTITDRDRRVLSPGA